MNLQSHSPRSRDKRKNAVGLPVTAKLRKLGAPEQCHAISTISDLDGHQWPLRETLDGVLGMGNGIVLSCIPGKLAYYESEEKNGRYILSRRSAA